MLDVECWTLNVGLCIHRPRSQSLGPSMYGDDCDLITGMDQASAFNAAS
ncbi:MAG: hypothetical protein PF904_08280 [Kiritimatiellae bacterium]|nr:hypothetical protein [Kiritimatiellia bacterium]